MTAFAPTGRGLFAAAIAPKDTLTIAEWAERYRHIGKGTSDNPGPWDNDRVPYMVEPMIEASNSEEIVFVSSAQISKTESLILNTIGYYVHQEPAPILCVLPDWDTCDELSRDRFDPMVRDTPCLQGLIAKERLGGSDGIRGSTKHVKRFPGGRLNFVTANSPAALASKPIQVVVIDELDRCQQNSEGDVYALAKKRTETFQRNRLIIRTSTPTLKDSSPIMAAYENTDQRKYFVDCPKCGSEQQLVWAQIKWKEKDGGRLVWYECPHCKAHWSERDRRVAVLNGRWKATSTPKPGFEKVAGFWIWAGYSLFTTMESLVNEFYTAKSSPEKLQVFINTVLGETWEDPDTESLEPSDYTDRCEDYPKGQVPKECLILTAGVDVQIDKLVLVVRGWAENKESWLIEWVELFGDTAQDIVWENLGKVLDTEWPCADGAKLKIGRVAVDSSAFTDRVYEMVRWLRRKATIDVVAVKGSSTVGKPIVNRPTQVSVTANGKTKRRGLRLWSVGVNGAKTLLFQRLAIAPNSPYSYHWPQLPEVYFQELTAERKVKRYSKGQAVERWELIPNRRNEVLDCEVYALFSALSIGIEKESFNWKALYRESEEPEKEEPKKKTRRIEKNWVNRF